MTGEFAYSRDWWCDLRADLNQRHVAAKVSQGAVIELGAAYGRIPMDQRSEVNEVLLEWVLSDDEGVWFDALGETSPSASAPP